MHNQNQLLKVCFQPIFYFFLLFVSGVFLENLLDFPVRLLIIGLLINLLVTTFCYLLFKSYEQLLSISLMIGFLLVGSVLGKVENERVSHSMQMVDDKVYLDFNRNQQVEIYGETIAYPKLTPDSINLDVRTNFISRFGRPAKLTAQVRLTIWIKNSNDYQQINLAPGTTIYALAELAPQQKFKNPGVVDNRQILIQQGYDFAANVKDLSFLEILYQKPPSFVYASIYQINKYLLSRIEQNFTPEKAGVLKAVILGDDSYISLEVAEQFRISGLYHILVISGSHIAFLTWILYKLVNLITKNRWLQFLAISVFIWTYSLITGADPPLMRAALMATVVLSAALWYRQATASNNIGIAGLVLLAYRPNALFEAGFQLTFLAVLLILLLVIPLVNNLSKIGKWCPTSQTPYPPQCLSLIKWLAELLFWSEKGFIQRQKESQIKYKLEKNPWAIVLEKYTLQTPLRIFSIMFITSTIVQLGLLPISIIYFHRVVFVGIILNIISEILMNLLLITTMLFIVLDFISQHIGYYLVIIIDFILTLFLNSAWPNICENLNNKLHILSYRVAGFSGKLFIFYILYFILLLIILVKINKWEPFNKPITFILAKEKQQKECFWNKILTIFTALCLLIIVIPQRFYKTFFENKPQRLEVVFLDVGQGDAIFIKFPQGTTMMIDSGGSVPFGKEKNKIGNKFSIGEQVDSMYLWSQGIEHLDYLVVTHPHSDHMEGFTKVIKNFSIGQAIISEKPNETSEWQDFIQLLTSSNIAINTWSKGESYFIDGVKIDVLWSASETITKEAVSNKTINNQSLVLRLNYQGHSLLLTGDIEEEVEEVLLNTNKELLADVLKAPHHGSKTSSSRGFLEKVNPKLTIISAPAKSRFNHPHLEVVERYKNLGVQIYQTGLSGAITVYIENNNLHIKEFAQPKSLVK